MNVLLLGDEDCSVPGTAGFAFVDRFVAIVKSQFPKLEVVKVPVSGGRSKLNLATNPMRLMTSIKRNSIVFYYGMSPLSLALLWVGKVLRRSILVPIVVEWPTHDGRRWLIRIWSTLYRWSVFRLADGSVVVSQFLFNKASKSLPPAKNLRIALPGSPRSFSETRVQHHPVVRRLTYCGDVDGYLSDALFLVRAWSQAETDLQLVFIGRNSESTRREILQIANKAGRVDQVFFESNLSSEGLASFLSESAVLALPILSNERNIARFPFKCIEYLEAGRPIVCSPVGEPQEYLACLNRVVLPADTSERAFAEGIENASRLAMSPVSISSDLPKEFSPEWIGTALRTFLLNVAR